MHDRSGRIAVSGLSKQFGPVAAVSNLSFTVEPGSITGFLGPNGSGKTTTLRMILGLVAPTTGAATINGVPFEQLGEPGRVVGAVLDSQSFHPKRTARNHLLVYTAAMGIPDHRADEVLALVGLSAAADRQAGNFSLGMKQRLALATALLGDPQVLLLDEPANGLDPEGIAWLRSFLQSYARSGRTVLISSHILAEVEQMIDNVLIVSRGQVVFNGHIDQLRGQQRNRMLVHSADNGKLADALRGEGYADLQSSQDGRLSVGGASVQQIGDIAASAGVATYGMQEEGTSLEQLFFQLTIGQYPAQTPAQPSTGQYPPNAQGWGPQPGYQQPPPGYQQPPPGYQQPPPGYQQPPPGYQQPPQQDYPPNQGGYGGNG